jgi:hypothetical protein
MARSAEEANSPLVSIFRAAVGALPRRALLAANTALAEFDRFLRYFNELRKFTTLPTMLMASTEMFFLPK